MVEKSAWVFLFSPKKNGVGNFRLQKQNHVGFLLVCVFGGGSSRGGFCLFLSRSSFSIGTERFCVLLLVAESLTTPVALVDVCVCGVCVCLFQNTLLVTYDSRKVRHPFRR